MSPRMRACTELTSESAEMLNGMECVRTKLMSLSIDGLDLRPKVVNTPPLNSFRLGYVSWNKLADAHIIAVDEERSFGTMAGQSISNVRLSSRVSTTKKRRRWHS